MEAEEMQMETGLRGMDAVSGTSKRQRQWELSHGGNQELE